MIALFEKNETDFSTCGIAVLNNIVQYATVEQTLNGGWFVNLTVVKDELEKYKEIEIERIITLHTPYGYQPFRIVSVEKSGEYTISVYARHIFFDLNKRLINFVTTAQNKDEVDREVSGTYVAANIQNNIDIKTKHNITSNIAIQKAVNWEHLNVVDALLGDDETSFVNTFGGELYINGWNARIDSAIGKDRGAIIRYGRNVTGINCITNTDNMCTRIRPTGADHIYAPDVDSENVGNYANVYAKAINFSDVKVKLKQNDTEGFETLEEAQNELTRLAKLYFEQNKCDLPTFSFDVNFINLKNAAEYAKFAILETMYLGDTVTICIDHLGINTKQKMVSYTYNAITHTITNATLGDATPNMFKNTAMIDKDGKGGLGDNSLSKSQIQEIIDTAREEADNAILNGGKDSYVKFLPNLKTPAEIIICDNENIDEAVYVVRLNKNGIGVSSTGVTGPYSGILTEGKLVINEITSNIITAALIRTGILSSVDGKCWINVDNGTFNFRDRIKFDGNKFSIYLSDNTTTVDDAISTETQNRVDGDKTNADAIATEVQTRTEAIATITARADEISTTLTQTTTTLTKKIEDEADARENGDNANAAAINKEIEERKSSIKQTADSITAEVSSVKKSVSTETQNRINGDKANTDAINKEIEERKSSIKQTASDLTATFTEMHNNGYEQGITTINKNGITVRHSNANTYSQMNANGFYVYNSNGEPIASLGAVLSWTEMRADRVYANNILNIYLGNSTLYVDHSKANGNGTQSSPFNNFNALKELLEATPIINKDITINVVSTGNVNDNLDLRGLQGRGTIKINLAKELVLNDSGANSAFYFYKVDNPITIYGNRSGYNSIDGALINGFNYGVYFNHCKYGSVEYLAIDTSGAGTEQWGVIFRNTNGKTSRVDFCDSWNAVLADYGSNVGDNDSVGNCKNAFYAQSGANIVFGSTQDNGYRPMGNLIRNVGCVTDLGNRAATASKRVAPPAPTTQTYTQTFGYTGLGTYQYAWSNWASDEWGNRAIQGVWNGYGNKAGHIFFNISAIRSFIGSGTVQSGTITLTRRNGGGYSSATSLYLNASTASGASGTPSYANNKYIGSLAWGASGTFTLPTAIINNLKSGYNSLALYSSSDTGAYAEIVSASITIKVTK